MPHFRSYSDDLPSYIPSTLSVSTQQLATPPRSTATSAPPLDYNSLSSSSPHSVFAPLSAPTLHPPTLYSTYSPSKPRGTSEVFGTREQCVDDGSSDIVSEWSHAEGHEIVERMMTQGGGTSESHKGRRVGEQEEEEEEGEIVYEETEESTFDWYSRNFGTTSTMSNQQDIEDQVIDQVGGGGLQADIDSEQAQTFPFAFQQHSPILSPSDDDEPLDLSPVSGGYEEGSPQDWFSSSSAVSIQPRATYGLEPSSLSPDSPPRPFTSFTSSDSFPFRRLNANESSVFNPSFGFSSFATASASLSQPPLASTGLAANLPSYYFLPASKGSTASRRQETKIDSTFTTTEVLDGNEGGGHSRQASAQEFATFHQASPSVPENRRLSCPSPVHLSPVSSSQQLSTLPCPSPNFYLDRTDGIDFSHSIGSVSSTHPCRFQLPPPFKPSLVDLPPLPSTTITSDKLPVPPSLTPDSSPPSKPNTNSGGIVSPVHQKKKPKKHHHHRRSSSTSSTPSFSNDDSDLYVPELLEKPRQTSMSSEVEGGDSGGKLEPKISPITGKPIKTISKRSWPPKDASKRRYACTVTGCGKNCKFLSRSTSSFSALSRSERADVCCESNFSRSTFCFEYSHENSRWDEA